MSTGKPLGEIGQIAFVTANIQQSMRRFSNILGIGPWFFEPRIAFSHCTYRGEATAMTMAVAIANNGSMQYELIQQNDSLPSIYLDFALRNPDVEHFQHVCIWADHYAQRLDDARSRGYELVQDMVSGFGAAAYLIHPDLPEIALEVVEANAGRRKLRQNVAAAAAGWDGSDPIRQGFPTH